MISLMFAVKDLKSGIHFSPFAMRTAGEASRAYVETIKQGGSNISLHPKDHDLVQIGTYNDELGKLESLKQPKLIISGEEAQKLVKKELEQLKKEAAIEKAPNRKIKRALKRAK